MKRIVILLLTALLLTGCAEENTEMQDFRDKINAFCDKIVSIDASINDISNVTEDAEGLENAKKELLSCLDSLEQEFRAFAAMDFPAEYDYLEKMSDEASEYMTEAVNYYHTIYEDEDKYNVNMEEYANENYARAYKRIQVIVALFRGETPEVAGLKIE